MVVLTDLFSNNIMQPSKRRKLDVESTTTTTNCVLPSISETSKNDRESFPFCATLIYNSETFTIQHRLQILSQQKSNTLVPATKIKSLCSGYFRQYKINPHDVATIVADYLGADVDRCQLNFNRNWNLNASMYNINGVFNNNYNRYDKTKNTHYKESMILVDYPSFIENGSGICFTILAAPLCKVYGFSGYIDEIVQCGIVGVLKSDIQTINTLK